MTNYSILVNWSINWTITQSTNYTPCLTETLTAASVENKYCLAGIINTEVPRCIWKFSSPVTHSSSLSSPLFLGWTWKYNALGGLDSHSSVIAVLKHFFPRPKAYSRLLRKVICNWLLWLKIMLLLTDVHQHGVLGGKYSILGEIVLSWCSSAWCPRWKIFYPRWNCNFIISPEQSLDFSIAWCPRWCISP